MKQKDKVEFERDRLARLVRTSIRTSHSIEADWEINEKLPVLLKKFDLQVQKGRMPDTVKMALEAV